MALKEKDYEKYKKYGSFKIDINLDQILKEPELNFGRDDSDAEDFEANG